MKKTSGNIKRLFTFGDGAKAGILVLLPLLAVAGIFLRGVTRIKPDPGLQLVADSILTASPADPAAVLFHFDPNTVTLEELCELGFDLRVAASIVKYRNAGKRFTAPEDLAMCYGVTLEKYRELEPYIVINGSDAASMLRRDTAPTGRIVNPEREIEVPAGPFDPNLLDLGDFVRLGFTEAQARTIVNYREASGGFTSAEHLGKCYAVSDRALAVLRPYLIFATADPANDTSPDPVTDRGTGTVSGEPTAAVPRSKVEINSADSATLRSVSGIGEVLVVRIMEYRDRLGGFVHTGQLAEVKGMSEANYEMILGQIIVDSCRISKIDINFAPHKQLVERLGEHPYVTPKMLRKLLSERQLKGGWSNTRELVEDKIWTEEEADRLAPYVVFRPIEQ